MQKSRGGIRSLEMCTCRRILKIPYQQDRSNKDILVDLNIRPSLMNMIKERKRRYFDMFYEGKRSESTLITRGQS